MNETLKGVAHIGAELAAAKADLQREMERHRKTWRQLEQVTGLLRRWMSDEALDNPHAIYVASEAALSQQAEPIEPAPAQDERQPTAVPEGWLIELGFDVLDRPFRFVDSKSHTPTIKVILPACEPDDSSSWDLRDEIARRIGSALATRPAQTEQQPSTTQQVLDLILEECRYWQGRDEARRGGFACLYAKAKEIADNAAPIAQTAPQPEQSGYLHRADVLKERVDKIQAEVEALRALLSKSLPVVEAHAGASHMLEGSRPIRNKWDELVDGIRAAMAAKEA